MYGCICTRKNSPVPNGFGLIFIALAKETRVITSGIIEHFSISIKWKIMKNEKRNEKKTEFTYRQRWMWEFFVVCRACLHLIPEFITFRMEALDWQKKNTTTTHKPNKNWTRRVDVNVDADAARRQINKTPQYFSRRLKRWCSVRFVLLSRRTINPISNQIIPKYYIISFFVCQKRLKQKRKLIY